MATHNGALFLRQQLESILTQLASDDEVIICDDHSADDTIAIINSFADSRIIILDNKSVRGVTGSFEKALSMARGEYIFLADQDDVWLSSKKSITLRYLQTYDMVVSDCVLVNTELQPTHRSFHQLHGSRKGFLKNLIKNSYMGCCMAFRSEILKKALPFPDDIAMHDQWLGMVGELYFRVKFIPETLLFYRKHERNFSSTGMQSRLSLRQQLTNRYVMIKNLFLHT